MTNLSSEITRLSAGQVRIFLSYGVSAYGSILSLSNNIITTTGGSFRTCIYSSGALSDPFEMWNNDFYNCPNGFYNSTTNIATLNALPFANGNISIDAKMDQASLLLTCLSPTEVTQGGLDGSAASLSWGYIEDINGKTRTGDGSSGWSMGAYEY